MATLHLFKCQCGHQYVGRTTQRLEKRIGQHLPRPLTPATRKQPPRKCRTDQTKDRVQNLTQDDDIQDESQTDTSTGDDGASAIHQHLTTNTQCMNGADPSHFRILSRARNKQHLYVLEALYIHTLSPELCRQKEHVTNLTLF